MIGIYKEMGSNVTNFVLQKRTHVYWIGNTVNKFVIVIRARNTSPRFRYRTLLFNLLKQQLCNM